jgi:hypothetical protein
MAKADPFNVRLEETERVALGLLAHKERRPLSAMAALLIVEGLERRGAFADPPVKKPAPQPKARDALAPPKPKRRK